MSGVVHWCVQQFEQLSKRLLQANERIDSVSIAQQDRVQYVLRLAQEIEQQWLEAIEVAYPRYGVQTEHAQGQRAPEDAGSYMLTMSALTPVGNFAYTHPSCVMTMGVQEGEQWVHGVLYDFMRDEMITVSRGYGAHVNRRRMRVTPYAQQSPMRLGIACQQPSDISPAWWARCMTHARGQQWYMSQCPLLDAAYVAMGRLDACVLVNVPATQLGLIALLLSEAGGVLKPAVDHEGLWVAGNMDLVSQLINR